MKKKRALVDLQKLQEINGNTHSYENYIGAESEDAVANPDVLPEQHNSPSSPQMIMGEAIQHLQGRQKEVYIAIMRDDKTQEETAEMLDISRTSVRTHLDRAIGFISQYCRAAMDGGRI